MVLTGASGQPSVVTGNLQTFFALAMTYVGSRLSAHFQRWGESLQTPVDEAKVVAARDWAAAEEAAINKAEMEAASKAQALAVAKAEIEAVEKALAEAKAGQIGSPERRAKIESDVEAAIKKAEAALEKPEEVTAAKKAELLQAAAQKAWSAGWERGKANIALPLEAPTEVSTSAPELASLPFIVAADEPFLDKVIEWVAPATAERQRLKAEAQKSMEAALAKLEDAKKLKSEVDRQANELSAESERKMAETERMWAPRVSASAPPPPALKPALKPTPATTLTQETIAEEPGPAPPNVPIPDALPPPIMVQSSEEVSTLMSSTPNSSGADLPSPQRLPSPEPSIHEIARSAWNSKNPTARWPPHPQDKPLLKLLPSAHETKDNVVHTPPPSPPEQAAVPDASCTSQMALICSSAALRSSTMEAASLDGRLQVATLAQMNFGMVTGWAWTAVAVFFFPTLGVAPHFGIFLFNVLVSVGLVLLTAVLYVFLFDSEVDPKGRFITSGMGFFAGWCFVLLLRDMYLPIVDFVALPPRAADLFGVRGSIDVEVLLFAASVSWVTISSMEMTKIAYDDAVANRIKKRMSRNGRRSGEEDSKHLLAEQGVLSDDPLLNA